MNYEVGEAKSMKMPSYTDDLVNRLNEIKDNLQLSSKEIYRNLDRLVGQDDILVEPETGEVGANNGGLYGTLHAILDELDRVVKLNQENNLKLNRIV